MLKIAIITSPHNGSPKVLAETLHAFIEKTGNESRIFNRVKALTRLFSSKTVKSKAFVWFLYKTLHYIGDKIFFANIKKYDAVVLCACSPYGFYNHSYNIERLKSIIQKPVLYYAVQYLENSPTILELLKAGNHASIERYDWHLTVSPVTEIRQKPAPPWEHVGMYLKGSGLKPVPKKEFFAIVDFERSGFEEYRKIQIRALEDLEIPYISLEKEYSMEEIRKIYQQSALIFLEFPEAYGLPIAECLSYGSYIFTPDSSWPMSWRLDEEGLSVHGPGKLAECFVVYDGLEDLKIKLSELRSEYDLVETPGKVFDAFVNNYPTFYNGNMQGLSNVLDRIRNNDFSLQQP